MMAADMEERASDLQSAESRVIRREAQVVAWPCVYILPTPSEFHKQCWLNLMLYFLFCSRYHIHIPLF
jgi:hypothetical protein